MWIRLLHRYFILRSPIKLTQDGIGHTGFPRQGMRLEEANRMVRGSSLVSRVLGLAINGELIKINISGSTVEHNNNGCIWRYIGLTE